MYRNVQNIDGALEVYEAVGTTRRDLRSIVSLVKIFNRIVSIHKKSSNLPQIDQSLKGVAHGPASAKIINYFLFNFNLFVLKGRMSLKGGIRYSSMIWIAGRVQ